MKNILNLLQLLPAILSWKQLEVANTSFLQLRIMAHTNPKHKTGKADKERISSPTDIMFSKSNMDDIFWRPTHSEQEGCTNSSHEI